MIFVKNTWVAKYSCKCECQSVYLGGKTVTTVFVVYLAPLVSSRGYRIGSIRKFPTVNCCNCLGERRWEGRPRSHFHKPVASVCHVTLRCEHVFFYTSAFSTSCFVLSAMDGKIEQQICIKFCMKLGKSAAKTLWNALWGFWRTFYNIDSSFWMAFTFQGQSNVSWRWRTFRVTKHQQNIRKCWKISRTHPQRPSPNVPWARRHRWDQLWRS
jgi:hypothetical protein